MSSDVQTVLMAVFTILIGIIGWFIREAFKGTKESLDDIRNKLEQHNSRQVITERELAVLTYRVDQLETGS